jgi:hypothetical protein
VDDFRVRVVINHSPPDGRRGLAAHLRRLWQVASADAEEDSLTTRLAWYAGLPDRFPFVESVLLRPNSSMDIGAYDHGYRALVREGYDGEVLYMNSSAVGPFQAGWLHRYLEPLRAHDAVGLCGISLNSHDTSRCPASFDPHVQSFFLLTHMRVLKQSMGPQLLSRRLGDKLDVIRSGEIGLSRRVLQAGYAITCRWFPGFVYRPGASWSIPEGDLRFHPDYAARANVI